jgi:hypothetical protein
MPGLSAAPPRNARARRAVHLLLTLAVAAGVFLFSWIYRFNDPGGAFAGLTDDHFFYVVRGWQILFGELPVRDFADHGAPLYFYVAWLVQTVFGRGTLSELTFSTTMLALGSALVFWSAARASGSIVFGLIGAAFVVLLEPRFYNYPKILVYAVAIPVLWAFADRPTAWRRFWLAAVTVTAFLLRHDHGVFVAIAMAAMIVLMPLSWRDRVRHAAIYVALILALLAPYLVFIQMHGGVVSYFRQASAWADRDRARAPMKWPPLFESSAKAAGSSVVAAFRRPLDRVKATSIPRVVSRSFASVGAASGQVVTLVRRNSVAWTFYIELLLPLLVVTLLVIAPDAFRPTWPQARAKIGTVAALGLVLDGGFLRSPLEARLADPSVPHAILLAWLCTVAAVSIALPSGQRPSSPVRSLLPRLAIVGTVGALIFAVGCVLTKDLGGRLEKATLTHGPGEAIERVRVAAAEIRDAWKLTTLESARTRPDLIGLSLYLNACTEPTDRVLVESYVPQVVALARRGFAGGQADVRLGLFDTPDAQQLTVSRLERQSVPVILLDSSGAFHADFPVVAAYVDAHYRRAGMHVFDRRFPFDLYVRRDVPSRGIYRPFGWPCYGSGRVTDS